MLKTDAGKILKHARWDAGLTLRELKEKSGVAVATLVALEKPASQRTREPDGLTIYKVAKALDLDPSVLFEEEVAS